MFSEDLAASLELSPASSHGHTHQKKGTASSGSRRQSARSPGRGAGTRHTPDVAHGRPQVQRAVCEGAVQPVLHAVAPGVRLVDARARLVVAQVVLALRVPGRPVQVRTPGKQRGRHRPSEALGLGGTLRIDLPHPVSGAGQTPALTVGLPARAEHLSPGHSDPWYTW